MTAHDRALGALLGLALGDAMGMPTQELSAERAAQLLGDRPELIAGPADNPYSAGLPAGHVTDDTDQALILAQLLADGDGRIDPHRLADELVAWCDRMRAAGSLDLLGPSTTRAVEAVRAGADPATTGKQGTTNGAAMRVTPVGVATRLHPTGDLVARVRESCQVTHDTAVALAGAVAVAAAVAAGVGGDRLEAALDEGVAAAAEVDPELAGRLAEGIVLGRDHRDDATAGIARIQEEIGTGVETVEAVPAAYAIAAMSPDNAWEAAWYAARLGGDSDTIAAMAAAMVGAATGAAALPAEPVATLQAVNPDLADLPRLTDRLLALREPGPPWRPRRLVGLVSILVDATIRLPHLPPRGGDVVGDEVHSSPGGGFNALAAAARLGLPCAYAGPLGTGPRAAQVRRALAADHIDLLTVPAPDRDTGYCLAMVEPDGERTFLTVTGADAELSPEAVASVALRDGDVLYVSGYDLAYPISGPILARYLPSVPPQIPVVLDPGPLAADIPAEVLAAVLPRVDLLSTSEAETLAAEPGAHTVRLLRRGRRGCRLITPGAAGAEPTVLDVPAAPAPGPVVDTNGAGDTHLGALLAGLGQGLGWRHALDLAARAAAYSVTRTGAASGPTPGELS